jgi:hypothetical protein
MGARVETVKPLVILLVCHSKLHRLLQLRNDPTDCRTLVYSEHEEPHVTWNFPFSPDPLFPMVFNRKMTREAVERKLVRGCLLYATDLLNLSPVS